tara:strand:- start:1867 stop:2631 length:765 start_codon:yes stop_codon:yes gene_type:complete
MKLQQNKHDWSPPTSFEEKIKHLIIPGKLYIRRLVLKEWIKGRTDIKFLKHLIDKNLNSIDVGAYKGVYTYFISKYSKHVYAFEPNPKSYKILKKTVKNNVKVLPYALSDKSCFDFLKIPKGKKGYSNQGGSIRNVKLDEKFGKLKIETKKIDDLKLKNIGFIKIDAEGVELKVLKGAKKLIKQYKPTLLIEIEERYISGSIEKSLNKILNLGYRGFALIGETITPLKFFDGNKNHRIDYGPDFHANAFIFVAK